MANRRIIAPAGLIFPVEDIRIHLNEFDENQDEHLTDLIMTAAEICEGKVYRSLMLQTREETLDGFPSPDSGGAMSGFIALTYPPIISIESVMYLDTDGIVQTLAPASYYLDNAGDDTVGWLALARGRGWPATYDQINSVRVRYIAGYESAGAIPYPLRQWIKIKIGDLYANRESVNVGNITTEFDYVDKMLEPYKIYD